MKSIAFKPTMPAVITKFTIAALLLVALAACNSGGGGGGGGAITGKSNSLTPTELVATGFYQGVDLTWKEAKKAISYTVYYSKASFSSITDSGVESEKGITTTNASITDLSNDTLYYLRVEANSEAGNYLSKIVTATTNLQPPTKLKATGVYKGVELSWKEAKGATSYTVYYHTASFSSITDSGVESEKGITTTNASIKDLTNDKKYYLRVKAIKGNEETELSEQVAATPAAQAPNLRATGAYKAIDLSWDAVKYATGYTVYYREDSGFDSTTDSVIQSKIVTAPATSITDLTNDTKYYLRAVTNYPEKKYSHLSEQVEATADFQAPKLRATGVNQAIDLSWDAVKYAASYSIYYHTASFDKTTDTDGTGIRVKSRPDITADNTIITGLTNGTKYYLRAVTNYWAESSHLSKQVEVTVNLPPPTNLKATGVNQAIDLSWDAVEHATGYKVYYHTKSFSSTTASGVQDKTTDTTAISITGLTNGTLYYFRAVTKYQAEYSKLSKEVTAEATTQAPNLRATGVNRGVDLSWDEVKHANSYTIYYYTASFSSTTASGVQDKTTDTTAISITDLTNGTLYYFRAVTKYQAGVSDLSEQVEVTADLQPPTNLKATGVNQAVDLSWDAVTGATKYTVYYYAASFDSTTVSGVQSKADITTDNTSITDLSDDTTYYFRVIASNPRGNSALSQIKSATTKPPAPHPSAAASIISPAAVDLSWDTVARVTGYKIYYAKQSLDELGGGYKNYGTTGIGGGLKTITDTKATSATIDDLSAGTLYYFVVTADYSGDESAAPEVTADSSYIAELAMGGNSGCVRLNTGGIKCWGKNDKGQLGVGDKKDKWTATSVSGIRAKQLSVGGNHSCAIDLSDMLYCWGYNGFSQLGLSDGDRISPTLVTQDKLAVSLVDAGSVSTCALAGGNNYCWGYQRFGALGNGDAIKDSTMDAQQIEDITPDVKQFAVGDYSGCAIDVSNDLWCWGYNGNGEVGDGTNDNKENRPSPVKPKLRGNRSKATMVDGIYSHYCVVDNANKIQCWGLNNKGQLGINTTESSNSPQYVLVSDSTSVHLSDVSKIATGKFHSCALIAGGKVRCWGDSDYGIIGIDPDAPSAADRKIADTDMGISDAIDIAAGYDFTCVLLNDKKSVKCWGANSNGQLGDDTIKDNHVPVAVKGL